MQQLYVLTSTKNYVFLETRSSLEQTLSAVGQNNKVFFVTFFVGRMIF